MLIPQVFCNHFYLVILNIQTKEISCLDPLKVKRNITRFISYHLKTIAEIRNEIWTVRTMPYDKQLDSIECGIFVLQYAERYIKNLPMINLEDKIVFRKQMHTKLLKYASRDVCLHCSATKHLNVACRNCNKKVCTDCASKKYFIECNTSILCKLRDYENNLKTQN